MWNTIVEAVTAVAAIATCFGVFLAWGQLRHSVKQAKTSFEDELGREYRELAKDLPVSALLGQGLPEAELTSEEAMSAFFHYFDLTNYQIFLRSKGRVDPATWAEWQAGIRDNLSLPAFSDAWNRVKTALPGSFNELRRVEQEKFDTDPVSW